MMRFIFLLFILILPSLSHAKDPQYCALVDEKELLNLSRQRSYQAKLSGDLRRKSNLSKEGIFYAEKCLEKDPKMVGCFYFRAVNRGLNLETRTAKTRKHVRLMIDDFMKVIALNGAYDQGGAYMAMGYVYLKLPGIPVMGDLSLKRDLNLATDYASKALAISPSDPENLKLMGEILYKKKDYQQALGYFKRALKSHRNIQNPNETELSLKKEIKKLVKKTKKKIQKETS